MGVIKNDILWAVVIDEKVEKMYIHKWQEIVSLIYENSVTFKRLPCYESQLFNNKYYSISQERIIRDLFDTIESMKDEEEREFNIFDEYTFKLKVIRMK